MTKDTRFGLPLSLGEALRADGSPVAAKLADLIEQGEGPRTDRPEARRACAWRAGLAGLALCASLGAQAYAAAPSLQGRWIMAPDRSRFEEGVTGPAPDAATLVVSQDNAERLTYALVETRGGREVASAAYDISFAGRASTSAVDHVRMQVQGAREADGGVVIRAPSVDGLQASIHLRRTGPDSALLEHEVSGADSALRVETISLVRGRDQ